MGVSGCGKTTSATSSPASWAPLPRRRLAPPAVETSTRWLPEPRWTTTTAPVAGPEIGSWLTAGGRGPGHCVLRTQAPLPRPIRSGDASGVCAPARQQGRPGRRMAGRGRDTLCPCRCWTPSWTRSSRWSRMRRVWWWTSPRRWTERVAPASPHGRPRTPPPVPQAPAAAVRRRPHRGAVQSRRRRDRLGGRHHRCDDAGGEDRPAVHQPQQRLRPPVPRRGPGHVPRGRHALPAGPLGRRPGTHPVRPVASRGFRC